MSSKFLRSTFAFARSIDQFSFPCIASTSCNRLQMFSNILNGKTPRRGFDLQMASAFHGTAQLRLDNATRQQIEKYIQKAPVVVFMKGTQQQPMCGFSQKVKLVLDLHRVPFQDFNVLEDEGMRQGIKEFSDWPTIPQVYVNGKFVGGSDILVQMHTDGEIVDFFDEEGIPSRYSKKFAKNEPKEEKKP